MAETNHLVHYTGSAEVVISILQNGFLFVPNKRYLINAFLGEDVFSDREPQEFGMVSFAQLPIERAATHRDRFGRYGIAVSWEWALRAGAQRVIYVDERGPIAETFAWLFRLAKQELDAATGGQPGRMVLENKAFGSYAKSTMWAKLLNLYEYMEPERNSAQVEWRVVNQLPQYHAAATRARVIAEILATAKMFRGLASIPISANDVVAFVCPRAERASFIDQLPTQFQDVPILTYRGRSAISRLVRARDRALFAHRGRERIIRVPLPPPKDTTYLSKDANGAYYLPDVETIKCARLFQDELMAGTRILIQFRSLTGPLFDLVVPFGEAIKLVHWLAFIWERSGLHHLHPLPPLERPRDLLVGEMRMGTARPPYAE